MSVDLNTSSRIGARPMHIGYTLVVKAIIEENLL